MALHGFATATPDFADSIFTSQDLAEARSVFSVLIERYAPGWDLAPIGVMAQLWSHETRPSIGRLIYIARVLFEFSRGITTESTPALGHKVRQLLTCNDDAQFDELMAELTVGAHLASRAGPIQCEPLARPLDYNNPAPSRSPDFSIRLAESEIFVEVTVLRIGGVDEWERAMDIIRERIHVAVLEAGLRKEVEIHVPLGVRAHELTGC